VFSRPNGEPASRLEWIAQDGGTATPYTRCTSQPLASIRRRGKVWLL
jgi:hypothetical protein